VLVCGSQDGSVYGLAGRAPAEGAARPDLGTARPDEGTAPSKPAWTPPPGWSDAPPARATEAAPAPTAPAAVSEAPSEVAMRLISEPSDGSEFPVQLTSTRRTVVAWGTTEPEAEVDGQPVRNEGGQIRVDRSFEADGIYPVVMVTGKGTDREVTQCRLVVVDTSDEPASRREAAFSPDGNGVGDTIAFRARAQGLNGRRVTGRTIDICRPSGEPVLSWVALGDGEDAMIWDGRDAAGSPAPVGTYVVIFSATDDAGKVHRMRQTVIVTRAGERVVGR
jgi:hypothetical protein